MLTIVYTDTSIGALEDGALSTLTDYIIQPHLTRAWRGEGGRGKEGEGGREMGSGRERGSGREMEGEGGEGEGGQIMVLSKDCKYKG